MAPLPIRPRTRYRSATIVPTCSVGFDRIRRMSRLWTSFSPSCGQKRWSSAYRRWQRGHSMEVPFRA